MFSERLKMLRENHNLYQKELASVLNVSSQTISGWEIGRTTPDFNMLIKIANYFNTTIDYLLGNEVNYTEIEKDYKDRVMMKKILINKGIIKSDEEITEEELDNIIEFIKINKKYIKH